MVGGVSWVGNIHSQKPPTGFHVSPPQSGPGIQPAVSTAGSATHPFAPQSRRDAGKTLSLLAPPPLGGHLHLRASVAAFRSTGIQLDSGRCKSQRALQKMVGTSICRTIIIIELSSKRLLKTLARQKSPVNEMPMQDGDHFLIDGTECSDKSNCLLSSVHSRLQEAHRHWHHALESYADPEGFRSYLNSCIQALRNVTFVLQQKKSAIQRFDEFYGPWQAQLREDRVLRWVVEARNQIVKQADLETKSIARTSMIVDYDDPPNVDSEVPPLLSTEEISCRLLGSDEERSELGEDAVFRLERRWVDQSLPDWELLDALAHAYSALASLSEPAETSRRHDDVKSAVFD